MSTDEMIAKAPHASEGRNSLSSTRLSRVRFPLGLVELVEYDVPRPGRFVIEPPHYSLEMLLTEHPVQRQGRFSQMSQARPLGKIQFLPADQQIEMEWPAIRVRAIRCCFRKEMVQPRAWTGEELVAALDVASAPVHRAMQSLAEELANPGFNSTLFVDSLSIVMAVELGRFLRRRVGRSPPGHLSPAQIALINDRIERHGGLPPAAELAHECRLSRRHFFRLFRQTTGMSLVDYAAHRRTDRAKALLRREELMVKQVAHRCGFQTPSAFSAAFRRATGMTPREYRLSQGAT